MSPGMRETDRTKGRDIKSVGWFLAWGIWTAAALARPLPFDPTPLKDAVQDGNGRIWAISEEEGLVSCEGGRWLRVSVPLPELVDPTTGETRSPRAFPMVLQTNRQGVAHGGWVGAGGSDEGESDFWITRLESSSAPVTSAFRARLAPGFLTFGDDDIGWLTEAGG